MRYLLLLIALTACSATGPVYTNQKGIIVYRDKQLVGQIGSWEVESNGVHACDLHGESYFILPPNGQTTLTASKALMPGTSQITFNADKEKTSYIRLELNKDKEAAVALSGYVGALLAEGVSSSGGPFVFTLINEQQAKQELQDLKQDCI